jgi:hypothetical protein
MHRHLWLRGSHKPSDDDRGVREVAREDHRWLGDVAAELEAASIVPWNDKRQARGVPGHLDFA